MRRRVIVFSDVEVDVTPTRMILPILILTSAALSAQDPLARVEQETAKVTPAVTEIRHQIHQNPELSNREEKTAALIADYLRKLGLEVQTGVARHGVVALLKGGRPGPVVAVRADIDALPVTEQTSLPFASKVRSTYLGQDVGVMHACGHDIHTAVQLGVATVLTAMKADLPGTVKFIFQPAEEGPPPGEAGGASLMVKEGVLQNPASAGDLRAARLLGNGGRGHRVLGRSGALGGRYLGGEDRRPAVARRQAGAVDRSHRCRSRIRAGDADDPIAHFLRTRARRRDDWHDSRRPAPQHHPR